MATILFYILSAAALLATLLCVTRRNPVHAVIFLVHAFFALALIFYILGAPLVAAWEVIIYAGATMVLFMFIIMMLELAPSEDPQGPGWVRWVPILLLSTVLLGATFSIIAFDPGGADGLPSYYVSPRAFGYAMFFMDDKGLDYLLDHNTGWEVGVGPSVVFLDEGMAKTMNNTTVTESVYVFTFNQRGLMAGAGIQGSKITNINP